MKIAPTYNTASTPSKKTSTYSKPKKLFRPKDNDKTNPKKAKEHSETIFNISMAQSNKPLSESSSRPSQPTLSNTQNSLNPLIHKLTDYIYIESKKGISKTTLLVSDTNSPIDGASIEIIHYDTNPHSFNLQLSGSNEALYLFENNLAALQEALKNHDTLKTFHIQILKPTLSQKPLNTRSQHSKKIIKKYILPKK